MTAKEYLSQIRKLDILIKQQELELEDLHYKMTGMSSIAYEVNLGFNSDGASPQSRLVFKYIETEKFLENSKEELLELKNNIRQKIQSLDNPEYIDLLYKRYFQFMKWEQISLEMHYTYRQILRIHGLALKAFDLAKEKQED